MKKCDTDHIGEAQVFSAEQVHRSRQPQCSGKHRSHRSQRSRRAATVILTVVMMFILGASAVIAASSGNSWVINVDGNRLVWLASEEEANQAITLCLDNAAANMEGQSATSGVSYSNNVSVQPAARGSNSFASVDEAAALLKGVLDLTVKGVVLQVDGVDTLYLSDANSAISAVALAKAKFGVVGENGVGNVYTKEQINIYNDNISATAAVSAEEAADLLTDTANPLISVCVEKESTETVVIPYEVQRVSSNELEVGVERHVSDGADGEKVVTYRRTEVNGKVMAEEELGELITVPVINDVTEVGHAVSITSSAGTMLAAFQWPVADHAGIISSYYGWRSRGWHSGVDIAADYDSTLVASEAGTVTFAGASGNGYGTLVIVDHGNNIVTYYAHLNYMYVSEGDYVERGDAVGTIGMTGTTTGPHIHFEIRIDNSTVDPLTYLE